MTAWPTPAALAAASRLSMVVWKNAGEASSKVGEFVRLTTTPAPSSASGRPCPVSRSRPVDGECGTASCPLAFRILTTCDPISPVPPMTAMFICLVLSGSDVAHAVRPGTPAGCDTSPALAQLSQTARLPGLSWRGTPEGWHERQLVSIVTAPASQRPPRTFAQEHAWSKDEHPDQRQRIPVRARTRRQDGADPG